MFYNREFLDELFLNRDRELYIKIILLTWDELKIKEIQGLVLDGSLNIDGNSIIRRSLSLNMALDEDSFYLHETVHDITISRKIQVYIGLKNNTTYGNYPDLVSNDLKYLTDSIIWFNIGIFVPTDVSLNHDIENSSISISAQDKMVLLNGDIAGQLGYDIDFVNTITNEDLPYQTIIKDSVSYFGGIDESKVLVLDVPYYAESLTRVPLENFTYYGTGQTSDPNNIYYEGTQANPTSSIQVGQTIVQIFTNQYGEGLLSAGATVSSISGVGNSFGISQPILSSGNFTFYISPAVKLYSTSIGNYGKRTFNINVASALTTGTELSPAIVPGQILPLQVVLSPKNKDTKIEVSSTDNVTTILDRVKSDLLGEYEYFFDIDGNFIFQFKKNLESSLSSIELFQNDGGRKYLSNFESIPYIYDFSDKEIISSYSNTPNWKGIKNDFYVYGANNLLYHLVIDTLPQVPSEFYIKDSSGSWTSNLENYSQPWQQYIIDLTEYNAQNNPEISENRYYPELKRYFEYNSEDGTGIYKKTSATSGIWRSANTGEEEDDFSSSKPLGDPFTWNYFFDMISDANTRVAKFSINAIGRRIKSIRDDSITIIYPRTLEPTYTDSSNRSVKVILYEDLESTPLSISSFNVTSGTTVNANVASTTDINVNDIIVISGMPPSFGNNFNGSWTINTVSSTTFGFTVSSSLTNSDYFVSIERPTLKLIPSSNTILTMLTGSQLIRTGMNVSGTGIQANTTVTAVTTTSADVNRSTLTSLGTARQELAGTSVGNYALFGGGFTTVASSAVDSYDNTFTRAAATSLSNARYRLAGAFVSSYGLFGGGIGGSGVGTAVDAYNTSLSRTSATAFGTEAWDLAATSFAGYAIFGGGQSGSTPTSRDQVYAYNNSLSQSTPTVLSVARTYLAAASNNSYAFFGGGYVISTALYSSVVDRYNTSLTRDTATSLSVARGFLAANSVNNHVLFAGGNDASYRNTIDAYDSSGTKITSPTALSVARNKLAASQMTSIALFGGGFTGAESSTVDYYDISLTRTVATSLSSARSTLAAAVVNDSVLFGGGVGSSVVDRYSGGVLATSVTISKSTNANIPYNTTLFFDVGNFSIAEYSNYIANNQDSLNIEAEFEALEIPYVSILKSQIEDYLDNEEFQYKTDAFSTMKNLIYIHTNFNQSVSINSIPLYFLEPNKKINLTDINTEIFGDHYLQSFSIPLSNDGTMQMSAIKIQT